MYRKRLPSPRCISELIDSAWVVIVPGQKCLKKPLYVAMCEQNTGERVNILTASRSPTGPNFPNFPNFGRLLKTVLNFPKYLINVPKFPTFYSYYIIYLISFEIINFRIFSNHGG